MEEPKLFISYSWSNPVHEQWVLDLATELRSNGVDVILDKWDLKEGHDAVAFMERMVTDNKIKKVAMITDEVYVAKADGRSGGVGTETQIISKEVYDKQAQDKFVAVVSQKDSNGNPYLPLYYKSRIYIDLSEPDTYGENFERLLRWIFDKPLYVKPEIGKKPEFLSKIDVLSLNTTESFKRVIDAVKNSRPFAIGALNEYLNIFAKNLERFSVDKDEGEIGEIVIKNIERFLLYRNEAVQLFITISQYAPSEEIIQNLHRFFEKLIPYLNQPELLRQRNEWGCDNFRFIVHELFLYATAILIKYERFEQANYFLEQRYYVPGNADYNREVMVSFNVFIEHMPSLSKLDRPNLEGFSVRADLLRKRCSGIGIDFSHLMQADFVLFMRAAIEDVGLFGWFPETLVFLDRFHGAFEIFSRSNSKRYFDKVKVLLAINKPEDLYELLNSYKENKNRLPTWGFRSFSPSALLGYEQLATRP